MNGQLATKLLRVTGGGQDRILCNFEPHCLKQIEEHLKALGAIEAGA